MNKLTPYQLSVLMHHYVSPAEYEHGRLSGLYDETIKMFTELGVWRRICRDYNAGLTDLGRAWCQSILQTPIPRQVFVDHNNHIIGDES